MAKSKLNIWDQRMIMLMDHCVESGVVDNQGEFLKGLGLKEQSIHQIKAGKSSFRPKHIALVMKKYDIDANWIFGVSSSMKRVKSKSALQNLRDAVREIEAEIKQ